MANLTVAKPDGNGPEDRTMTRRVNGRDLTVLSGKYGTLCRSHVSSGRERRIRGEQALPEDVLRPNQNGTPDCAAP